MSRPVCADLRIAPQGNKPLTLNVPDGATAAVCEGDATTSGGTITVENVGDAPTPVTLCVTSDAETTADLAVAAMLLSVKNIQWNQATPLSDPPAGWDDGWDCQVFAMFDTQRPTLRDDASATFVEDEGTGSLGSWDGSAAGSLGSPALGSLGSLGDTGSGSAGEFGSKGDTGSLGSLGDLGSTGDTGSGSREEGGAGSVDDVVTGSPGSLGAAHAAARADRADRDHRPHRRGDGARRRADPAARRLHRRHLDGPRRLAVVTCGGELTYASGVGDYTDNVYVYAEPVR